MQLGLFLFQRSVLAIKMISTDSDIHHLLTIIIMYLMHWIYVYCLLSCVMSWFRTQL